MGLDMDLYGIKYFTYGNTVKEDGLELKEKKYELGYWRKHPNLHGYIVKQFAKGVDDCSPVKLDAEDLKMIIMAIKQNALPETQGFFFGKSDPSMDEESILILTAALNWMNQEEQGVFRSIEYQASW